MSAADRSAELLEHASAARRMATFSPALSRAPHTHRLFGVERVFLKPLSVLSPLVDFVVGWGAKATAIPAEAFAQRHQLPYLRAEDGFLRSPGLGVLGDPSCSVVLDDLGIYYDATRVSRLEQWLNDPEFYVGRSERQRAACCIERITSQRLSKYNHTQACPELPHGRPIVVVVDQTAEDLSVRLGMTAEDAFQHMLRAALTEHPDARIVVKVHPDVITGKKRGYLQDVRSEGRVLVLADHVNPIALLERAEQVYVATSQLGFEALMLGKKVTCFGVPFYSGWGLTDDRVPLTRRRTRRSVEEVFSAAYLHYARYVNPLTGRRCQLEGLMDAIVRLRESPDLGASARAAQDAWSARPGLARADSAWSSLVGATLGLEAQPLHA